MRLLHTADWHLGRALHGRPLLDDQRHVLEQVVALAREARPDAVLIAGDLFDRAVPPAEAVALLDEVLAELVLGQGLKVVAIAGNHDSPARLAFGARLMRRAGLVVGATARPEAPLLLEDRHGTVEIHALAYAEPAEVRLALGVEAADHAAALRAQIGALARDPARRAVLVAHAFVAGGLEARESERPLSVGGAGTVPPEVLEGFAYVALGHLHRPQQLAAGRLRYAGAPLAYAFDEAGEARSVSLVEIGGSGELRIEALPLAPLRPLERREGLLAELLQGPACDSYLSVRLLDRGALLDPFARLEEVFANLLHLERAAYEPGAAASMTAAGRERGLALLFADFFEAVTGAPPSEEERAAFAGLHDDFRRQERDA